MKFSLKSLILTSLSISLLIIQITTQVESSTKRHQMNELKGYLDYQQKMFNNLTDYLLTTKIADIVHPLLLDLESKDETCIVAPDTIKVNKIHKNK